VDKIDFDDEINHPPQVVELDPPNDAMVIVKNASNNSFRVTIWEPDIENATSYEAVIWWWENMYNNSTWINNQGTCKVSEASGEKDSLEQFKGTGILLYVDCNLDLSPFPEPVDDQLTIAKISISDHAIKGNTLREGAGSIEVSWILWQTGQQ